MTGGPATERSSAASRDSSPPPVFPGQTSPLPPPRAALVWYETKAIVLIDLDELHEGADPLNGFDALAPADDILGGSAGFTAAG